MKVNMTARHFKARPDLSDAVHSTANNFAHFHDGIISVDAVLDHQDLEKSVEFIVHVSGKTIVAKERTDDFMKSLHGASDNIIRQIRKLKTKAEKSLHESLEEPETEEY